jgi:phospholipase C
MAGTVDRHHRCPEIVTSWNVMSTSGGTAAPFDTVVVVMMENRSFDHLLGWAGTDAAYLDAGRQRYGADFTLDGNQAQTFVDAQGG